MGRDMEPWHKLRDDYEALKQENDRIKAILQAIHEYDWTIDNTYTGLIDWLESVSPYEDVISELEATNP